MPFPRCFSTLDLRHRASHVRNAATAENRPFMRAIMPALSVVGHRNRGSDAGCHDVAYGLPLLLLLRIRQCAEEKQSTGH